MIPVHGFFLPCRNRFVYFQQLFAPSWHDALNKTKKKWRKWTEYGVFSTCDECDCVTDTTCDPDAGYRRREFKNIVSCTVKASNFWPDGNWLVVSPLDRKSACIFHFHVPCTWGHYLPLSLPIEPWRPKSIKWENHQKWLGPYRHPGFLCTPQNFAQSSTFSERKKNSATKVTFEASLSISQNLKVTRLQGCTQTKLWNLLTKLWSFKVIWTFFFWGSFIASLCSSRWSEQKCKTEYEAL